MGLSRWWEVAPVSGWACGPDTVTLRKAWLRMRQVRHSPQVLETSRAVLSLTARSRLEVDAKTVKAELGSSHCDCNEPSFPRP